MKNIRIASFVLASIFTIACTKEISESSDGKISNQEVFKAIVEDDLFTKSDYNISGSTAYFQWLEGDQFGRLIRHGNNYSTATFTAISVDGNSGTFSGTHPDGVPSSDISAYAVYPINTSNGSSITPYSANHDNNFYLNLPSTITYDCNNPLRNIVPMMGKLSGSTFTFYPLTGVIGFQATNIPATATSITLSTTGTTDGLSGNSVMLTSKGDGGMPGLYLIDDTNGTGYGLRRDWMAGNTPITLTFEAGAFSEGTFYFPVPVTMYGNGNSFPYTNLTITLKNGETVLSSVQASGISLTVSRGQIRKLPNIAFPHATLSVGGTSEDIKVTLTEKTNLAYVKVYAATTSAAAEAGIAASGTTITNTDAATSIAGFSDSGRYYIAYQGYDSSNNPISYVKGSLGQVYYVSSTDARVLFGTYKFTTLYAFTTNNRQNWVNLAYDTINQEPNNYTDSQMTIAASNDPALASIMVTNFLGFGSDGVTNQSITDEVLIARNSNSNYYNSPYLNFGGTYSDTDPLYGSYSINDSGKYVIEIQRGPLFILDGVAHYLTHGQAQYSSFKFETTTNTFNSSVTFTYGAGTAALVVVPENKLMSSGDYDGPKTTIYFRGGSGNKPTATRTIESD